MPRARRYGTTRPSSSQIPGGTSNVGNATEPAHGGGDAPQSPRAVETLAMRAEDDEIRATGEGAIENRLGHRVVE